MNQALGKLHQNVMAANTEGVKTAKDLAALRSEVEELPRKALSGLAPQIDEVRMSLNSLQQEFGTVRERDTRNTAKDIAVLRSEVEELPRKALSGLAPQIDDVRMGLNSLQQEFGTRERDSQRSMQALLDNLGNNMTQHVGKLDKRCSDMGELVDRQAAEQGQFRIAAEEYFDRMDKRFTSLADSSADLGAGLSKLQSSIGRLANNTASELQTTRDEIEQICNSLCNVSKSWGGSNIRSQQMSRSMMSSESRSMDIRTAGG